MYPRYLIRGNETDAGRQRHKLQARHYALVPPVCSLRLCSVLKRIKFSAQKLFSAYRYRLRTLCYKDIRLFQNKGILFRSLISCRTQCVTAEHTSSFAACWPSVPNRRKTISLSTVTKLWVKIFKRQGASRGPSATMSELSHRTWTWRCRRDTACAAHSAFAKRRAFKVKCTHKHSTALLCIKSSISLMNYWCLH